MIRSGRAKTRILLAILVMWLLPALLCTMQGGSAVRSFLSDLALHTRSLLVVPLFILAEYTCLPLLQEIGRHFSNLVRDDQRDRYEAWTSSILAFNVPTAVTITSIVCVYTLVMVSVYYIPSTELPSWQKAANRSHLFFSFAGWWHWLVSIPLLLYLVLLWLFRIFLWSRFLWQVSRLRLMLVLSHPDRVGGLKFLNYSSVAFAPLSFALGSILAGMAANRVFHHGESPLKYQNDLIGLVVVVIVIFCGPLAFFAGKLFNARRLGVLRYSGLAYDIGCRFERKWLDRSMATRMAPEGSLEVPDFSATADLYSVVNNVYRVQLLPLDLKGMGLLAAASLLPFFPLLLAQVPFKTLIEKLAAMLI